MQANPKANSNYWVHTLHIFISLMIASAGFLGNAMIEALLLQGEKNITVFDCTKQSKWIDHSIVRYIHGTITNAQSIDTACRGMQIVFLTAAIIRPMDTFAYQYEKSFTVNVEGVQHILFSCQRHHVSCLIYSSTLMVNVPNTIHIQSPAILENHPYVTPATSTSHYALTKAIAEELILSADSPKGLRTISLRPSTIIGQSDHLYLELMLATKKCVYAGFTTTTDFVHVDNVVYAHLLAMRSFEAGRHDFIFGQAFNISNFQPMTMNEFNALVCHHIQEIKPCASPPRLLFLIAHLLHIIKAFIHLDFAFLGHLNFLTPNMLRLAHAKIIMNNQKAKTILGYAPITSVSTGIKRI